MSRLVVWSRRLVSNLRFQRSFLKTDSCDRALSRSGVSNLRYLQLIFETCSSDRDAFGASVSNLRFQRCFFQRYTGGWVPSRSDVLVIETPRLKSTVSTVTFRDRYLGMSYVSIIGMIETVRLKSTVSTVLFSKVYLWMSSVSIWCTSDQDASSQIYGFNGDFSRQVSGDELCLD